MTTTTDEMRPSLLSSYKIPFPIRRIDRFIWGVGQHPMVNRTIRPSTIILKIVKIKRKYWSCRLRPTTWCWRRRRFPCRPLLRQRRHYRPFHHQNQQLRSRFITFIELPIPSRRFQRRCLLQYHRRRFLQLHRQWFQRRLLQRRRFHRRLLKHHRRQFRRRHFQRHRLCSFIE